jgi:hypothetical protein
MNSAIPEELLATSKPGRKISSRLLRVSGWAKPKEHGAKGYDRDFYFHVVFFRS